MILNFKKLISGLIVVASFNSMINVNASYYHKVREEFNQSQALELEKDMYGQTFDMLEEGVKKYTSEDCDASFKNSDFGKIISFYISIKNGISDEKLKFYKEKYKMLIDGITDKKSAFDVLVQLQNEFEMVYGILIFNGEVCPGMPLCIEGTEEISDKDFNLKSFF